MLTDTIQYIREVQDAIASDGSLTDQKLAAHVIDLVGGELVPLIDRIEAALPDDAGKQRMIVSEIRNHVEWLLSTNLVEASA